MVKEQLDELTTLQGKMQEFIKTAKELYDVKLISDERYNIEKERGDSSQFIIGNSNIQRSVYREYPDSLFND